MSINLIEAVWITINIAAIVVVISNLLGAIREKHAYVALAGPERGARSVITRGNERREWLRLIKQFLLLIIVIPSAFSPGDINLSLNPDSPMFSVTVFVVTLMAVPLVMLYGSVMDARDRRSLAAITYADLLAERDLTEARMRKKLAELAARADKNDQQQQVQDERLDALE